MWFVQYENHHLIVADSGLRFVRSSFSLLHPPVFANDSGVRWQESSGCSGLTTERLIRVRAQILWPCSDPAKHTAPCFHNTASPALALCRQTSRCACVCVCTACLCIWKSCKISGFSAHKRHIHVFSRVNSAHTHLRAMSLFSHLLSKGIFWGSTGQWIPAYSCLEVTKHNWPTPTNNKIAVLKMCSLPLFWLVPLWSLEFSQYVVFMSLDRHGCQI